MSGTIALDTHRAQTAETVLIKRPLPEKQFIRRQLVPAAGLFKRNQATANRDNDLRFAASTPTVRFRFGKIGDRQARSLWPNDVRDPSAVL